jgi:hypothetical protein
MIYSLTPTTSVLAKEYQMEVESCLEKPAEESSTEGKKVQYRENTETFLGRTVGLAQCSHP